VGGEENITSQTQENIEKEKFHLFVSNYENMKTHLGREKLNLSRSIVALTSIKIKHLGLKMMCNNV
jgi:hypothetical protein